jgi:N-acyl-D-amino-acid deacylase
MGSVAKAVTAIAIMMLVDAGKLTLDTNVFPLLDLEPPHGATIDPRFNDITVEHLLVHSGGWDRDTTGVDPTLLPWSRMAAANVGVDDPPEAVSVVRFMLGMGLDFDPGSKSVYSNFGFSVLGRVIEQASGQPYGEYVRDHVLAPIGITTMQLGRTREIDRAPGEVHYYAQPDLPPLNSVFWGDGFVPAAYGSFYLEGTDAHGGWIMNAADMVRLTLAVDGQRGAALLSPAALESMLATPRPQESGIGSGWNKKPVPGGLGLDVTPVDGGFEWSKGGALTGTCGALPFRRADGLTFTFVVNTLPDDFRTFVFETAQAILVAADSVSAWPEHDLFAESEPAATPGA